MDGSQRKPLGSRKFWLGFAVVFSVQWMLAQPQPSVSQEEKIRELERKLEEMDRRLRIAESRNAAAPAADATVAPSAAAGTSPDRKSTRLNSSH